jgi:hypothetical protein
MSRPRIADPGRLFFVRVVGYLAQDSAALAKTAGIRSGVSGGADDRFPAVHGALTAGIRPGVTTLLKVMVDPGSPLTVKARCAYYILDQTRKGIETEEIEARVAALEAATKDQQRQ